MIDLYYWKTPNGHKITIFLEEAELPHRILPVRIGRGEQFAPDFLAIAPNNRIPAIVDRAPADGGAPISVFESGAILLYLAEKSGRFLPAALRARVEVWEWLMWQMGGLGPMLGQNHHFRAYAPDKVPYAIDRYTKEAMRLYYVLNKRLEPGAILSAANTRSRIWLVIRGRFRTSGKGLIWPIIPKSAAGSRRCARARRWFAPTPRPKKSHPNRPSTKTRKNSFSAKPKPTRRRKSPSKRPQISSS